MEHNAGIDITIVMVPREKHSYIKESVSSLLENTGMPFKFVYVDTKSPPDVALWLRETLEERPNTTLLRYDHYLGIHQTRNIGLEYVDTPYVAVVDNDLYFKPGWLEALYRCAEEEGAGVVTPVITIGGRNSGIIHVSGGDREVRADANGDRYFHHIQGFEDRDVADIEDLLVRTQHTNVENHCFLARTEVMRAVGKLDPGEVHHTSTQELSLVFQQVGAKIMLEPSSRVVYLWGGDSPLKWSDIPFWYTMWSEKWTRHQMRVLANKYQVKKGWGGTRNELWWLGYHRRVPLYPLFEANRRFFNRIKLPFLARPVQKAIEMVEVLFCFLFVEVLIHTPSYRTLGCPSIFQPYPQPWWKSGVPAEAQAVTKVESKERAAV